MSRILLLTLAVLAFTVTLDTTPITYGQTATLTVCKDLSGSPRSAQFTVTGNNPSPSEFELGDTQCMNVTIGPGEYEIVEDPGPLHPVGLEGDCTRVSDTEANGEIQSGETQTCNFTNLD